MATCMDEPLAKSFFRHRSTKLLISYVKSPIVVVARSLGENPCQGWMPAGGHGEIMTGGADVSSFAKECQL